MPLWRASRKTANSQANEANLDFNQLPTGLRVALEKELFRAAAVRHRDPLD
jgi:hypothetical protein